MRFPIGPRFLRRAWRPALLAALASAAALAVAVWLTPVPAALESALPESATILDAEGGWLAEIPHPGARAQHPDPLIVRRAPTLARITVALEDHRFYSHGGVDARGIAAAAWRNLRAARVVSGASTITQQLVKTASGRPPRTLAQKFREAAAAWKLEHAWNKERVLARYLNTVDYGNRLLGAEAAARAYFGRGGAGELTLAEAVYLAGLPQSPARFNPWRRPAAAEYRYQRSVRRLALLGAITSDEARALADHPPRPGRFLPREWRAPHFVDALLARTRAQNRPLAGIVRTPLDPTLQSFAEQATRAHLDGLRRHDATHAAAVILDSESGAVRALVGSRDWRAPDGQNNGALRPRSAGSALKPFLYALALDRGTISAASILPDLPDAVRARYADYDPQNFSGRHLGPVRARLALGNSLNVPAVVLLERYGARQGFADLARWGVRPARSFEDYGAGWILGNAEVSLLGLANAFSTLARGGLARPDGPRLAERDSTRLERAASSEACAVVTDILCDPDARRETFGPDSPLDVPARAGVKTGTSSGFRDGWCAGFTGRHVVAVWAGNFDGRPMGELLAVRTAGPLWRKLTDHLLAVRRDPPVPAADALAPRLESAEVCPLTGRRPAAAAPSPGIRRLVPHGNERPRLDRARAGRFGDHASAGRRRLRAGPAPARRAAGIGAVGQRS